MALTLVAASSDYVALPANSSALQNVPGATLCAWVTPATALPATEQFMGRWSNGLSTTSSRIHLSILTTGAFRAGGRRLDADVFQSADTGAGLAVAGTRYHLAARLDYVNGDIEIYVNGVLVTSNSVIGWTGNSSNTTSDAVCLGQSNGGANFFNGTLEGVKLFSRALSASEILTIATCQGHDGIRDGLVHEYLLNEQAPGTAATGAGTCVDTGSAGVNGTPTSSPTYGDGFLVPRRRYR